MLPFKMDSWYCCIHQQLCCFSFLLIVYIVLRSTSRLQGS
jgi:hypothetical protein